MIDLELAKAHLAVDGTDRDALIQSYSDAAAALVEGFTGQLLTRREVVQAVAALSGYVSLWWGPDPEFAVGQGIDYLDADAAEQTVTDPRLVRGRVYAPVAGWPTALEHSPIAVSYTAGFADGAVPADLVQAQLMLVGHWFANREAVATGVAPVEMPLAVEAICRRYRPVLI